MKQKTFICEHCNRVFPIENMYEVENCCFCPECYDWHTTECECCGERFLNENVHRGTNVCEDCFEENYVICCRCGEAVHCDDAESDRHGQYYCSYCFDEIPVERNIMNYSYKPTPIFYGKGNRYFGVELEIDVGGYDHNNAKELKEIANAKDDHLYIKEDGSLNDGFEMVSHPMTLDYHINKMPWEDVMKKAVKMGYLSHKTSTCGLHIHVDRISLGDSREEQDEVIARIMYFVEHNWDKVLRFSRRTQFQLERWANRYGCKSAPKEIMDEAKKGCQGRYVCINIMNYHTVEFRVFRGTLKYNTFIAALQFVNTICEAAFSMSDKEIQKFTWDKYLETLNESEHKELLTYLDERGIGKGELNEGSSVVNS